jgi:hypothetical protein
MKSLKESINEGIVNEMGPIVVPVVPNVSGCAPVWVYVLLIILQLTPWIWLVGDAFIKPKVCDLLDKYDFSKLKKELEDVPEFQDWMNDKNHRLKDLVKIVDNLDSKHYDNAKSAAQRIWDEMKEDAKIR